MFFLRVSVILALLLLALFPASSVYAATGWKVVTPPTVSSDWTLYGVHFTSSSEGWAVGSDFSNDRGVLLHYSGASWTSVTPPSVSSNWELFSVHFTSSTEGWAVGRDNSNRKGVLLHYSSGTWSSVTPPYSNLVWQLNGVYFTSANNGWAVGEDNSVGVSNTGVLLHYVSGTWLKVNPPFVSSSWTLNNVHFTSPTEGWAVGDNKMSLQGGGVLLHFKNSSWVAATPPNAGTDWDMKSVQLSSANEGWAAGNDYHLHPVDTGLLLHYTSGTWTPVRPSHSSLSWYLLDNFVVSSTEGWGVGIDVPTSTTQTGLLIHYSSGTWSFVTPPTVSSVWALYGVHFTSADEGWAVGGDSSNGRGVLLKYLNLPDITVTPATLEFGNVSAGKTLTKTITVKNDGKPDLTLGTISTPENSFTRSATTCTNGKILSSGGTCSITIRYAPPTDGLFTSTFTITSDDPVEPIVAVSLLGSSGPPDLTGEWASLAQTCTTTARGTTCRLAGVLTVDNVGFKNVTTSTIKFYLSSDDIYDVGIDTFLKSMLLGSLKFGFSKNLQFSYRFRLGLSASGQYVIAVIDPNNRLVEALDDNNIAVSDLIPTP